MWWSLYHVVKRTGVNSSNPTLSPSRTRRKTSWTARRVWEPCLSQKQRSGTYQSINIWISSISSDSLGGSKPFEDHHINHQLNYYLRVGAGHSFQHNSSHLCKFSAKLLLSYSSECSIPSIQPVTARCCSTPGTSLKNPRHGTPLFLQDLLKSNKLRRPNINDN